MKYRLLKDLPRAKIGTIVTLDRGNSTLSFINTEGHSNIAVIDDADMSEWLEPIIDKKYDDLKEGDRVFYILSDGTIGMDRFETGECRSETFLTHEEAEDEHKRREFSVRPDRFIPKEGQVFYTQWWDKCEEWRYTEKEPLCNLIVNLGLAFRTRKECEKAIKEHDLIRLFYTIR